MPNLNPERRAFAAGVLDERQKKDCSEKNIEYKGRYCEHGGYALVDKNGYKCKGDLCIDHIDNDNDNNPADGSNWQWLCRGHNGKKNHRQASQKPKLYQFNNLKDSLKRVRGREGASERGDETVEEVIRYAEMRKNKDASPLFREFVSMVIAEMGCISKRDLIDSGAEYVTQVLGDGCGIDQQTAERYLKKLCAPLVGKYEIYNINAGKKDLKPEWWVRERRDQDKQKPAEE